MANLVEMELLCVYFIMNNRNEATGHRGILRYPRYKPSAQKMARIQNREAPCFCSCFYGFCSCFMFLPWKLTSLLHGGDLYGGEVAPFTHLSGMWMLSSFRTPEGGTQAWFGADFHCEQPAEDLGGWGICPCYIKHLWGWLS